MTDTDHPSNNIVAKLIADANKQLESKETAVLEPPELFSTLHRQSILHALADEFGVRLFARHSRVDVPEALSIRVQSGARLDLFSQQEASETSDRDAHQAGRWPAAAADFYKRCEVAAPGTGVFGLLPVNSVEEHNDALHAIAICNGPPVFFGRSPRFLPSALVVLAFAK